MLKGMDEPDGDNRAVNLNPASVVNTALSVEDITDAQDEDHSPANDSSATATPTKRKVVMLDELGEPVEEI